MSSPSKGTKATYPPQEKESIASSRSKPEDEDAGRENVAPEAEGSKGEPIEVSPGH